MSRWRSWVAVLAAVLAACGGDSTGPTTSASPAANCGSTAPTQLAPGAHVVLDPAASGGCLVLPAAGAAGAEHLVVALSTSGQVTDSGVSAPYTLSGQPGGVMSAAVAALTQASPGQAGVTTAARFHDMLRTRGRALARGPALARAVTRLPSLAIAPPPAQRSFQICANPNCSTFATVTAALKHRGTHGLVYQDTTAPANGFTQADLDRLGSEFDSLFYPIDTTAFGRVGAAGAAIPVNLLGCEHFPSIGARFQSLECPLLPGETIAETVAVHHPLEAYRIPSERDPRRPVVSEATVTALLGVADRVHPYLHTLILLARATGRRFSAVLGLRWDDVDFENGKIRWRAEHDKLRKTWVVPASRATLEELVRFRAVHPGVGKALLFPHPMRKRHHGGPVTRHLAAYWLKQAYELSGASKPEGSLWHAFRRLWATERKTLPVKDVAAAGGWKDVTTLIECYQQPDDETLRAVVEYAKPAPRSSPGARSQILLTQ